MILFHGTSTDSLPQILEHGILPRNETGLESNWTGDVASKLDLVYLTTAYPVYYGITACGESLSANPVVVKVNIDEDQLFPDEDFLANCLRNQEKANGKRPLPLKKYNALVNPRENADLSELSLQHNGVVSVGRVFPEQIVAHIVLEMDYRLLWIGGDAAPIPRNYRFLGSQYCRYVEALFNGGIDAAFKMAQGDRLE